MMSWNRTSRRRVLPARAARPLAFIAMALSVAGCADALVTDYEYGTIEVLVASPSGAPADGIPLILYRGGEHLDYGRTDASGRHLFEFVPFGRLGVFATLPATYTTADSRPWAYVDEIVMEPGGRQQVVLEVIRCESRIDVRVVDDAGDPVSGVTVDLYTSGAVLRQDRTDLNGEVEFVDVPCGNLGVAIAVPEGFTVPAGPGGTYRDGLLTREDDEYEIEFVLTRG